MKKFIYLFVAMIMLTGCGGTGEENAVEQNSPQEVDIANFTDGDFTVYGENGVPYFTLGMEKSAVEERLKSFDDKFDEFELDYFKHYVTSTTDTKEEELLSYISYKGPNLPVYTSKGIATTGVDGRDEGCSADSDIISGYEIDVEKESYIEDKMDDKNYCITLLYKDDERIVSPKDTDLSTVDFNKKIRYIIRNGLVKGIQFYQNSWE